ncbi:hypothetical protein [Paenibacillus vini]|uniref:Large polyvalent protein associated domain-containing protein n=1 Tax=Paenibacillus vini TaxID=1476024 RepID=A0ABQ4MGE0_9BACL|nr:hypothetical protein [Paenibacillus vini]GIP55013.1 hypothetical protein J42TS3_40480 [Paenibacillus vini]
MYYIKDATFRRTTEYDGVSCAEIQVRAGAVGDPDLFVYIARSSGGGGEDRSGGGKNEYEIIRMIRSDADLETDWFDNSMHQATAVVAEEDFCESGWPSPEIQREQFLKRLLAHDGIASRLQEELDRKA